MRIDCGPCFVRHWTADDKSSLLRYANDRTVWRNLTHRFPHPYTEADADFWLGRLATLARPTHWAIEVDGQAVGGVGVELGEGVFAKAGRFGYWLGRPFWGRGIMTAAVRVITDHVFANFEVARLEAAVFEWNPASMRVLEKCRFVREGVQRKSVFKDGELIDAALYSRLRTDA
jgi:RimJ/RimL family protein N-acetyltransferase